MLATRIKARRMELGITLQELSVRTRIDPSLVSRYETGKRLPTREHLLRLAEALKENRSYWLELWLETKLKRVLEEEPLEEIREKALRRLGSVSGQASSVNPLIQKLEDMLTQWKWRWDEAARLQPDTARSIQSEAGIAWSAVLARELGIQWDLSGYREVLSAGKTLPEFPLSEHLTVWRCYQLIQGFVENPGRQSPADWLAGLGQGTGDDLPDFVRFDSLDQFSGWMENLEKELAGSPQSGLLLYLYFAAGLTAAGYPLPIQGIETRSNFCNPVELGEYLLKQFRRMVDRLTLV